MTLLRKRDTQESSDFWDFVERTAGCVNGTWPCEEHGYRADCGQKPDEACETCWRLYFDYEKFKFARA